MFEQVLVDTQVASIAELYRFARAISDQLVGGDLLVLTGELGAGKTTFTRGLAEALGVQETVSSPTFILARIHETAIEVPLIHLDAYRLSSALELDDLGLDYHSSITVAEWGKGMLEAEFDSWLELVLERVGIQVPSLADDPDRVIEEPRRVRLVAFGERWQGVSIAGFSD